MKKIKDIEVFSLTISFKTEDKSVSSTLLDDNFYKELNNSILEKVIGMEFDPGDLGKEDISPETSKFFSEYLNELLKVTTLAEMIKCDEVTENSQAVIMETLTNLGMLEEKNKDVTTQLIIQTPDRIKRPSVLFSNVIFNYREPNTKSSLSLSVSGLIETF